MLTRNIERKGGRGTYDDFAFVFACVDVPLLAADAELSVVLAAMRGERRGSTPITAERGEQMVRT
jgi:hypothetical protein